MLIKFSPKRRCLFPALSRWVKSRRLHLLQLPLPLPAGVWAQRVNDEPVKDLNWLFSFYFIWNWGENFEKLHFFTFSQSIAFTQPIYHGNTLKNWHEKKKCDFKWFYLKSWGEFRVKMNNFRKFLHFSSKQACFFHALSTWVHGRRLWALYSPVLLPVAHQVQRVNDEAVKDFNFLFFSISFGNEEKLSKNRIFSPLDQSNAFT